MTPEVLTYKNADLVLRVGTNINRELWDESRYEGFIEGICGGREYQRQAILTTLRYLLGGQYESLRAVAHENYDTNSTLQAHYGSWSAMNSALQFPDKLSASLDLATGTGKSYVLYAVAMVLLAEGVVDSVLVLCPSLTIESGLTEKFRALAGDDNLRSLLPEDARVTVPSIIDANQSITDGTICVENYHAVLENTGSSIRESLRGRGGRVAVLSDEAHHVANASGQDSRKWKEFLSDPEYGFRLLLGVSGTCYVGDDYFSDVIYRYSLRQAIEDKFVKDVRYTGELADIRSTDEKWQFVRQLHESVRAKYARNNIRPLTIVVTKDIARCKAVSGELRQHLVESGVMDEEQALSRVLTIYNNAPDVSKLKGLDDPSSEVEWVVSVSMLNEGWDVKRVFVIVPHEERAFNSKLLIAQVLGRGLRIPEALALEPQPVVTVLNHEAWAPRIRKLVSEVLEDSYRLSSRIVEDSPFNFTLHTIDYERIPDTIETPFPSEVSFLEKGYIDLPTDTAERQVEATFEDAVTSRTSTFQATVSQATYEPRQLANEMHERLVEIDEMNTEDDNPTTYHERLAVGELERILVTSLERVGANVATERMRQRILASMGVLNRGVSRSVTWRLQESRFREVSTLERQADSVSASDLRSSKYAFYTSATRSALEEAQRSFFDEAIEEGRYGLHLVANSNDFKCPLNLAIADSRNEQRFISALLKAENADALDAWLKSVPVRFYDIDYTWRRGAHQKQGKFSPDFLLKLGDLVVVVEVKGDEEIGEPSQENVKKNEYAKAHFDLLNEHLIELGMSVRYKFLFLSPRSFDTFFQLLRAGNVATFRSDLDVALDAALRDRGHAPTLAVASGATAGAAESAE